MTVVYNMVFFFFSFFPFLPISLALSITGPCMYKSRRALSVLLQPYGPGKPFPFDNSLAAVLRLTGHSNLYFVRAIFFGLPLEHR